MLIKGSFDCTKNVEKLKYNFLVEEGVKEIELIIKKGSFQHVIIQLVDSKGKYRALTSFKTFEKEYYISKDNKKTSNCCIAGEIPAGEWKIRLLKNYVVDSEFEIEILGNREITNGETRFKDVVLTERFADKKEWYFGELHNHTKVSDGKISLEELEKEIVEKKLDFIFPTEHNSVLTKYPNIDIPVIPSTELTLDDLGHFNFFGLKEFIDYYSLIEEGETKEESLRKIFEKVKSIGGMISLNHPFHNSRRMPLGLMYNIDLENLDFLEVVNSPTVEGRNSYYDKKALEALDILWSNGYKVFAVAGSDNHGMVLGDPLNYIRLDEYSTDNILKSLKLGRSYVSRIGELELEYRNNGKLIYPGEEVKGKVEIKVKGDKNLIWKVIKNNRVIETVEGKELITAHQVDEKEYLRVEATDIDHEIFVVINPVHNSIDRVEPQIKKWFEIKDSIWRE